MNKDPKIVVENVIDSNGTKTDTNKIDIYPVTITRYAFLEMIDSPFLNPEVKFGISTVIPTAYVFCSTSENLRKYTSGFISIERIAAIYLLRCSGVTISILFFFYCFPEGVLE